MHQRTTTYQAPYSFAFCMLAILAILANCARPAADRMTGQTPFETTDAGVVMLTDGGVVSRSGPDVEALLEASAFDANRPDTETVEITRHRMRLFAARGQWMAPSPTGAFVLVKDSETSDWRVFHRFDEQRVLAIRSFQIAAIANGGVETEVLIASTSGTRVAGVSQIAWAIGDSGQFDRVEDLPNADGEARSMAVRLEGTTAALYIGTRPGGIYRYEWNATSQRFVAPSSPELALTASDKRVMSMALCGGGLYATVGGALYRRADTTPARWQRWIALADVPASSANSGLRGLTCVTHEGAPALLASLEGAGSIGRISPLPSPSNETAPAVMPAIELDTRTAIAAAFKQRAGLNATVSYVIPAYSNFMSVQGAAEPTLLFGVEWSWEGACAQGRSCSQNRWDDAACFFARRGNTGTPTFTFHCLTGPSLTPRGTVARPIRYADAFVAIRTIAPSVDDEAFYFGGYDCNSVPSSGTAWMARVKRADLLEALKR
jgi:hypothetical protein